MLTVKRFRRTVRAFPSLCLLLAPLASAQPLTPGETKSTKASVDQLRKAATMGDARAVVALEKRLYARDEAALKAGAAAYLAEEIRKAKAGDPAAMVNAGHALAPNWRTPTKDERDQGAAWFAKARDQYAALAERGDAEAQYQLALLLQYAEPISNPAAALNWLKKSAAQGHAMAMTRLADLMIGGKGMPVDYVKGVSYYEKAAAAGDPNAAHNLGMFYYVGGGNDQAKSAEWMMKADAMGRRSDGCWLGYRYIFGRVPSIPHDPAKALALIEPRAAAGVPDCFPFLAKAFETGTGVEKDLAEAYKWYALSVLYEETRFSASKQDELSRLKKILSADIVREGEQRAYAFEFTPMDEPPAAPVAKPAAVPPPPAALPVAAEPSVDAPSRRLKASPNDFALIVGIERYRSLPAADYAENDAVAVHRHLADLGVPERNIISLKGDEATRSKLQAYLEEWLPRNVKADSRVYFYFSGHGSPDSKSGQAYLIPSDGDPSFLKSTAFAVKDVYAALNRLPAKQVIVALDSCFSGAGGRSVLPKGARPLVAKVELASETGKLLVFAAAAGDEISGGLDEQRHGAFTYYFLRGLSGEARTPAGTITADSLQNYLRGRVGDAAHRQNRDQTPQLIGDPETILTRF